MELFFGLLGTFLICGLILIKLIEDDKNKKSDNRSEVIYNSSEHVDYVEAKEVFKVVENIKTPHLIDDWSKLSTGWNCCIGVMGTLKTLDENITKERFYGDYDGDHALALIGVLALNGYDIYTKDFVEFWRGTWNGLPECSLFYRYIDANTIELKAVKIK